MGLPGASMAERAPSDAGFSRRACIHDQEALLLAGVRQGDRDALTSLFRQYQPLLMQQARRLGLAPADAEIAALEVLADVALALMRTDTVMPRRLVAYVMVALRHWIEMKHRSESSYLRWCTAAATSAECTVQGRSNGATATMAVAEGSPTFPRDVGVAVGSLISEDARRASVGPDWSPVPAHTALAALATCLDETLREEDRLILTWTSEGVPLRTVAEWLGVSHAAAAKRASRLRTRLRAVAVTYADTLPPADRRYIHRFLARASAAPDVATSVGSDTDRETDRTATEAAPDQETAR